MEQKIKIKELRSLVPISISEGIKLLKENENDVEKCASIFIESSIDKIVLDTHCLKDTAEAKFREEKYDINVAISIIKREMYDANYKPIEGLTRVDLLEVRKWFGLEQADGFYVAMAYTNIEAVIKTLRLIPSLTDVADIIQKAYKIHFSIFEGYSDNDPIEEFVLKNKQLDDNAEFNKNLALFKSKTIKLNEELTNHIRNSK